MRPPLSLQLAALATLLVHALIYLAVPAGGWRLPPDQPVDPPLSVTLVPTLAAPEDKMPVFVRAPLDVEETPPQEDHPFVSDRDQVAAQPDAVALSEDNTPAVQGDAPDINRIVQGSPFQQDSPPPAPPAPPAQAQAAQPPQPAQSPQAAPDRPRVEALPDRLEDKPESEEGFASAPRTGDNPIEPEREPPPDTPPSPDVSPRDAQGQALQPRPPQPAQEASPQPLPRPRLVRDNSHGPLRDAKLGVSNNGRLALDARRTDFGVWHRRTLEVIEIKWNQLIRHSKAIRAAKGRVELEITIDRMGQVVALEIEQSTAGHLAESFAKDAVRAPSPFDEWTPEMILELNREYTFNLTFLY